MAEETDIGVGRVRLVVDATDYDTALARAMNSAATFGSDAAAAFDKSSGGTRRAARSLLDYVANLGKSSDELRILRAAQQGVDGAIIEAAAARMLEYRQSVEDAAKAARDLKAAQDFAVGISEAQDNSIEEQRRLNAINVAVEARERETMELREQQRVLASLTVQGDAYEQEQRLVAARQEGTEQANLESAAERELASARLAAYNANQDAIENERQRASMLASLARQADEYEAAERALSRARGEDADQQQYLQYLRNLSDTAGRTHYEILELKAAQLGISEQAAPFIASLKEQSRTLGMGELSSKQYAAALRGVPAQMTDIFTSIAAGQPPLMVMLQQGGQLKDMFGGLVPAVRALGAEMAKLATNPYLLTAAAVGTIAYAWYDAANAAEDYATAIAKSGNQMGVTADQIAAAGLLAAASADSTIGKARDAAVAVAATGAATRQSFGDVTTAVVQMVDSLGYSVDSAVSAFDAIGNDPVKGILKLNDSLHFLTAAQYEQIRALQQQGHEQEAATLAQQIAADAVDKAADQVREAQNKISRGWQNIKQSASEAWRSMQVALGLGSDADELQQLLVDNDQMRARMREALEQGNNRKVILYAEEIKKASARINELAASAGRERADAERNAALQAANEVAIANSQLIDDQAEKSEKRAKAVAAKNLQIDKAIADAKLANDVALAERLESQRAAAIAAVEKKYRDPKSARARSTSGVENAESSAALQAYKDQLAQQQAALATETKALQVNYDARRVSAADYYNQLRELAARGAAAEIAAAQSQIDYLEKRNVKGRDAANVQKQIGQLQAQQAQANEKLAQRNIEISGQEETSVRTRTQAMLQYGYALEASELSLGRQISAMVAKVGMGDREAELQQRINDLYARQSDELRNIAREAEQAGNTAEANEIADSKRAATLASISRQIEQVRTGYDDLAAAESDWRNGMLSAWENFKVQTADVAGYMQTVFGTAFGGIGDAVAAMANGASVSFESMTRSILANALKLSTNRLVMSLIERFAGSWLWSTGSLSAQANDIVAGNIASMTPNALGGVYASESLSQYRNQVVSQPTVFAFAKGGAPSLGVMGEAGDEAIMPLAKDGNGELGVKVKESAVTATPQVNIEFIGLDRAPSRTNTTANASGGWDIQAIFDAIDSRQAEGIMNGTSQTALAIRRSK